MAPHGSMFVGCLCWCLEDHVVLGLKFWSPTQSTHLDSCTLSIPLFGILCQMIKIHFMQGLKTVRGQKESIGGKALGAVRACSCVHSQQQTLNLAP